MKGTVSYDRRSSLVIAPVSGAPGRAAVTIHRGYRPGCIGRIAELHASYYHRLVGFGLFFESKVARELSEFCERSVEGRDGLWLALRDDRAQRAA